MSNGMTMCVYSGLLSFWVVLKELVLQVKKSMIR